MANVASRPAVSLPSPIYEPPSRTVGRSLLALVALAVLIVSYGLIFGWLSLARYYAYEMHALDMGNMGQAAWNTIHGHPFFFTNMRLDMPWFEAWHTTTRLSFHVEPTFLLISLVYFIYPHPESLLILQTAVLALGAIPVYLLARDVLEDQLLALAFAAAYLLFPTLQALNLYEFHPVSLATPLLLFAFWFAWRRYYALFIVCCLAAMGTKEEIGLVVAMFGLYVALVNRNWKVGLGTAAIGVIWSLFAVLVVEHHFRQPGTLTYTRSRFGYLGHGIHGVLHTVLRNPQVIVQHLLIWPKLGYLRSLLVPVGFLSVLAPLALFLGAPTLLLNLLSANPSMYSGLGDNSAELISVVMIAAVLGTKHLLTFLEQWLPRRTAVVGISAYLLLAALWEQHYEGFGPFAARFRVPVIGHHQRLADRFIAMVPPSAPVATQDQLDPHLSSRQYLYLFGDTGRQPLLAPANEILLDVSAPTYAWHGVDIYREAQQFIQRPGWGVAAADNGLILIRKGATDATIPARFYSFLLPGTTLIPHPLSGQSSGLRILGYDVTQTDQVNHRIPNEVYSLYLRPTTQLQQNLQPVVFETMAGRLINCVDEPLGLSWLPTSRWTPGRTYMVRMNTLELPSGWNTPGRAKLFLEIGPVRSDQTACSALWARHSKLWPVGTLNISF